MFETREEPGSDSVCLVSIALATFNGEAFIREFLDSLASQSFQNFEIVVSDDASADRTVDIVQEYANRFRIRLEINVSRIGVLRNFEKAISRCRGKYIALADQDDVWHPEKLSKLLDYISGFSLIHSDARVIDCNGRVIYDSLTAISQKPVLVNSISSLVMNGCVTGCTAMFDRRLLSVLLPFPEGDYIHDRWISVCASGFGGIRYLDDRLIDYRQHGGNVSGARRHWSDGILNLFRFAPEYARVFNRHFSFIEVVDRAIHQDRLSLDRRHILNEQNFYKALVGKKPIYWLVFGFRHFEAGAPPLLKTLRFINIFRISMLNRAHRFFYR